MNVKSLQWLSLATALAVLPAGWASAQQSPPPAYASIVREGYKLGKADAEKLEASLASNPDDLQARTRLLGYYWRGARYETPETKIVARRRHILWLIEHRPASEPAGLPQATIDPTGHGLADKVGYEQASKLWLEQAQRHGTDAAVLGNAARKLWLEQAQRHGTDAAVLGNAARFFRLPDKAQAEALLRQAQRAAPHDLRWTGELGYLYAIGVLGIDMINENGLPMSHNPAEAKGDFARRAREELQKSKDLAMVSAAGMILSQYGVILEGMFRGSNRPLTVDYAPLTEALLLKAQALDPANQLVWSGALEQFRKLRLQLEQRQ